MSEVVRIPGRVYGLGGYPDTIAVVEGEVNLTDLMSQSPGKIVRMRKSDSMTVIVSSYSFTPLALCQTCDGTGDSDEVTGLPDDPYWKPCPDCGGSGAQRCSECEGGIKQETPGEYHASGLVCPSPGCWSGWQRAGVVDFREPYASAITLSDRQARDMGADALKGPTAEAHRAVCGDKLERALLAAWVLSQ